MSAWHAFARTVRATLSSRTACVLGQICLPWVPSLGALSLQRTSQQDCTSPQDLENLTDSLCHIRKPPIMKMIQITSNKYSIGFVDICLNHLSKNRLSSDIPNLKCNLNISRHFQSLNKEINADSLFVLSPKEVLTESHDERGLSHGTISQHNYFILEMLRLVIFFILIIFLFLGCRLSLRLFLSLLF